MKVLVTGGNGFVGSAVVRRLSAEGCDVVAAVRKAHGDALTGVRTVEGAELERPETWSDALEGVEIVVHAAARVHRLRDESSADYDRVNFEGTRALADRAAAAGVRRLVFLSSIKVNGAQSKPGRPFRSDDRPQPVDAYARSKLAAEQALRAESRLECVIVRPPLVYGPGVKANFRTMMKLVAKGVPLPLGAVTAKRSLVALDNLVDLVWTCARHPQAANCTFLASDGEDLSVRDLLRRLGEALGRPARLISVPPRLLEIGARLVGRDDIASRLLAPLEVDSQPTRDILGWRPPVTVAAALRATARAFLDEEAR